MVRPHLAPARGTAPCRRGKVKELALNDAWWWRLRFLCSILEPLAALIYDMESGAESSWGTLQTPPCKPHPALPATTLNPNS